MKQERSLGSLVRNLIACVGLTVSTTLSGCAINNIPLQQERSPTYYIRLQLQDETEKKTKLRPEHYAFPEEKQVVEQQPVKEEYKGLTHSETLDWILGITAALGGIYWLGDYNNWWRGDNGRVGIPNGGEGPGGPGGY